MYTYIVERTQIYLSSEQAAALDREARRTGTTRSHLIREAIDRAYLTSPDRDRILVGLRASAGAWKNRTETGEEYVERIRGTERMARLWEREASEPESDATPGA
jgi:predicted transcriptional regulator